MLDVVTLLRLNQSTFINLLKPKNDMITLQINRGTLKYGMCDIEKMIAEALRKDLGAKKADVTCLTRKWEGHICPEFRAKIDGVNFRVVGSIDPYAMAADPWDYEMTISIR